MFNGLKNYCTEPPILLADIRRHVNVLASHSGSTHGERQPNPAWVEKSLGIYSDFLVALSKKSGGTQLAPQNPIFFTKLLKIILTSNVWP